MDGASALRRVARFGVVSLALVFGAVVILVGAIFVGLYIEDLQKPAILANLPERTDQVAPEWNARVQAAFPPGTDEKAMVSQLKEWRFQIHSGSRGPWAQFQTAPVICQDSFTVSWNTDSDGIVSDVQGDYHLSCL